MLSRDAELTLLVAGRNRQKAGEFCSGLQDRVAATLQPEQVDQTDGNLADRLRSLHVDLVIHTAGPYLDDNYHVAKACLGAGVNYLDLADSRDFAIGIDAIDRAAREKGILIVFGASTVPGVSSAVVKHFRERFDKLNAIDISIAPGQKVPRGLATLESVLSYCGRPFQVWRDGAWSTVYGWQGLRRLKYPRLGTRWAAWCDVPDLGLFPMHYGMVRSVRFDAALELAVTQWGLWLLSWLVRWRLIRKPAALASTLLRLTEYLDVLGSDTGGMRVSMSGCDHAGQPLCINWDLVARNGHGPEIPIIPAVILARRLAHGECSMVGATACFGLVTLEEITDAVQHLDIETEVQEVRQ